MSHTIAKAIPAIAAALIHIAPATAQSRVPQPNASAIPDGSRNGMSAIRAMGDQIDEIASRYGMSAAQLADLLRSDLSAYITPDGQVFYVCPEAPLELQNQSRALRRELARGGIPLDDFLNLESMPGAQKTVYLDFTGHQSVNNGWGHNVNFPAWDRNGNPGVFTDAEKQEIIDHWLEVTEDFAPFQINVTTKDPGLAALTKSGGGDTSYGIRVVMTQVTSGFGAGTGGIALLGTFDNSDDTPCFVFNKGVTAGPMSASHEAGHTLALQHDGLNGSTYHPGSSGGEPSWGPIMGAPFGRTLVQWSNGDYPGATQSIQQDITIITNSINGVSFVEDDHPDTLFGGTPITSGDVIPGLITSIGDIDSFGFNAFGGDVTIEVRPSAQAPNLDAKYNLYRGSPPMLIEQFSPPDTINAIKTYSKLEPGSYTVAVEGGYQEQTNGPVSNYGSTGAYTISLTQTVLFLELSFTSSPPTIIAPGVATPISVFVQENGDTLVGVPMLNFQRAGDATPTTLPMSPIGGDVYSADLPEFECNDDPSFWITAEGVIAGMVRNPTSGAYQAIIGEGISQTDDGETDIGWSVSGNATGGQWVRGVPQNNGRSDPPSDYDGSGQCWQTGLLDGEPNSDVDGGETILTSPVFDYSVGGTFSFAYWMNDETNTIGTEDYFRVEVSTNGGSTWATARSYTPSTTWRTDTIDIGSEFGPTDQLRVRFIAADQNPGDILECAIDAIAFESFGCTQTPDCLADANGDGQLTPADFTAWVAAFNAQSDACDQNGDGSCTPADFTAWVANFNTGCN